MSGLQTREQQALACSPARVCGNGKHSAGPPCFHVQGLAFEKCGKEKGSALRRKTKELLRLNIPCPTAPLLPSLSHICSHHQKKVHLSHISQPAGEQRMSVLSPTLCDLHIFWLSICPEGILGERGAFKCLRSPRREHTCPQFCVLF